MGKNIKLAFLNTHNSPLITFIICCACQGMGVIMNSPWAEQDICHKYAGFQVSIVLCSMLIWAPPLVVSCARPPSDLTVRSQDTTRGSPQQRTQLYHLSGECRDYCYNALPKQIVNGIKTRSVILAKMFKKDLSG